jgi:GNAT superfamily N-acetyltransferase
MSTLRLQRFIGKEIHPYLDDVARLRIELFRDYPYLYDGTREYEAQYLERYSRSPHSLFVLVFDGNTIVGATTGLPLLEEVADFQQPFKQRRWDVDRVFYLGESVLQKAYRGQGIGVKFFQERERYARTFHRITHTAFCAVVRPANDPRRPADYLPLDRFWGHRGYVRHAELSTTFTWKEIDEPQESPKRMTFWVKELDEQRDISDY